MGKGQIDRVHAVTAKRQLSGDHEKQVGPLPVFLTAVVFNQNYLNHCLDLLQAEARLVQKLKAGVVHPALNVLPQLCFAISAILFFDYIYIKCLQIGEPFFKCIILSP